MFATTACYCEEAFLQACLNGLLIRFQAYTCQAGIAFLFAVHYSSYENHNVENYERRRVMESKKFDPKKLEKLNDPQRLTYMNPDVVWNALNLMNPQVLVDIGAGTGFFSVLFSDRIRDGKVYSCDISDVMIEWMKENLPQKYGDKIIPLKIEESAVPLPDAMADLVYMINLHHELEEPERIISESFRLLRHGGKLMIIDWKKEETPQGPPLSIRVEEETIISQMKQGRFSSIASHKMLPYHNFVVGEKL